jgi:hypothetical protein
MSVVVALNKGAVTVPPPMLEPRLRQFPQDAFDINPVTVGVSALVLVAGLGFVIWNWWMHGRDHAYLTQYYLTNDPREHADPLFSHQPVVVEFEPPQNLRPAELGLILDERADAKDLTRQIGLDADVEGIAGGRAERVREDCHRRPLHGPPAGRTVDSQGDVSGHPDHGRKPDVWRRHGTEAVF